MLDRPMAEALANAGVGAVIAVAILVGLYRIVGRLGGKFIEAQQRQAEALGAQAQAMEGLTRSVGEFLSRDMTEHREMLVLLRLLARRQETFEEVRREHNECKAQAHPGCAA